VLLLPAGPMTPLLVGPTGVALAALEACCDTLCGWGHPGQGPLGRLRRRGGQSSIDLHALGMVAVTGADHPHQCRGTWRTPRGPRHPTSVDHLAPQWPFGTIAHVAPRPGLRGQALAPYRHAVPGPLGPTPQATGGRQRVLQRTTPRRRRHRQPVPLSHRGQPPAPPVRPPPLVVAGHPAMRQRGPLGRQPRQGQWVPRAGAATGGGHTGFVPPGLRLRPLLGQGPPQGHQGVALARHVAQGDGPWAVGALAQATAPRPGPPSDSRPDFGNPAGAHTHTPSACPHGVVTGRSNAARHGASSHAAPPMQPCRGRRDGPKRDAIAALCLRLTADSRPQTEVLAGCVRVGPWQVATKGAIKVCKRGMTWSTLAGAT
jgi:hypothetical protein